MSTARFTNLSAGKARGIVVVQPNASLRSGWSTSKSRWDDAFANVFSFHSLRHIGTLTLSHPDGRPDTFSPCNGEIELKDPEQANLSEESLSSFRQRDFLLACTNPRCQMRLVTPEYMRWHPDFQSILLHLMLKQVVPNLPCCDFIDCSNVEVETIRRLGFLAVDLCLWGELNNSPSVPRHTDHYGLGFMLMPNMHIRRDGCSEWSEWLQYLIRQKFIVLRELYDGWSSLLRGPKPA